MGVLFGSTGMTPWIQTLIVNHLKDRSGCGTSTTEEQDLPHRPRLVQIVGRGGTWWQNPDAPSSSCYLEITDGQHCIQVHLTPTCQASLRQQHFQYADQCRQGCLVVIEEYTVQIQQMPNNAEIVALLATHIQLKGGSETGICHPLEPIQDSIEVKRYLQHYNYKQYQKAQQQRQNNTNTTENRPGVIGNVHDLFESPQGQDTMEQVLQELKRRQLEEEEKKQTTASTTRQQEQPPPQDNQVAMLRMGNVQDLLDSQDVVMEQVLDEARRRSSQQADETTVQEPEETTDWRVPPVPRKLGNVEELLQSPEKLETVLQLAETAMATEQMIMEQDAEDDDDDDGGVQEIVHKQPKRLGGPSSTVPHWSDSDDDDDDDEDDDEDPVIGISKLLDSQPTQELEPSESTTERERPEREVKIPSADSNENDDEDPEQQVLSSKPLLNDDNRLSKQQRPPIPKPLNDDNADSNESDDEDPESSSKPLNDDNQFSKQQQVSPSKPLLNDNRLSKKRPPIPNYEAVGTTARSPPSERSDKENSGSSERKKAITARASKPTAEKTIPKKRAAAAPDPIISGSTIKKKKRRTSLWQRLANNKATASIKTEIN
jgi:hypothetical protein